MDPQQAALCLLRVGKPVFGPLEPASEEATDMTELPVSCTLSERDLAERRAGLLTDLRRYRQGARWSPDGVALRFPFGPSVMAALTEFIRLESQCCPFLRFQLTVEPGGGPVWLELSGPAGTRDFLADELEPSGAPTNGQ
jgi:hypothetical protein